MVVRQYDVYLINLEPAVGHEIKKTVLCLIIPPDEMNTNISTVIIAPMTTRSREYPSRVPVTFAGKEGWIVLDQIRTIDRARLLRKLGRIDEKAVLKVKDVLNVLLVK